MRRFIYTDKVGAGPEHPNKRWGLFSTELTAEEAKVRYELDAARREDWFGIVLLEDGDVRPASYLQMCPRANGVVLQKLDQYGSVISSYTWGAYYTPAADEPYDGELEEVFLHKIIWYAYPEEPQFFDILESLGHVSMSFRPDGYAKKEVVTADQPRYYDGLYRNPDGTYTGVEIKSGHGVRNVDQKRFDGSVSRENPATAVLHGESIQIVNVHLERVK